MFTDILNEILFTIKLLSNYSSHANKTGINKNKELLIKIKTSKDKKLVIESLKV